MAAVLYGATAFALLWCANRWIAAIRRYVAIVLILMPALITGRAIFTDRLFGPFDLPYDTAPLYFQAAEHGFGGGYNGVLSDLYLQIIPYRKAVRDAIANGEWPLWNRYTASGEPLAAEGQAAVYSPFTLLALLLPVPKSFAFTATLWFFIAALGAYLLARELESSEIASLFAGAAFMASSAFTFFILWPLAQSWTWLPLIFVAVRRLHVSPWPLVVMLTLLILTGHPESVLHLVFLGAAYAAFFLWRAGFSRPKSDRLKSVLHGVIAGGLTLGICAIYLLPFREASKVTEEYQNRVQIYAHSARSFPAHRSIPIVATNFIDDLEQRVWPPYSACAGSIALALVVFALWRVRGPEKWFFLGLLLFCVLEHAQTPLEDVLRRVPLFDIAVNDRFVFGGGLAFAVLAAFGLDELSRTLDARRFGICAVMTIGALVIAERIVERNPLVFSDYPAWGDYRYFAQVALLAIGALIVIARPRIALPALFACLLVQRTIEESRIYPVYDADVAYPPVPIFEPLKNVREPFRIIGVGGTFFPGTNAFYGIEDARGYSAMTLRRYSITYDLWCRAQPVFVNLVDDMTRPFLSVLNVRFAIAPKSDQTPPHWREVTRYRGARLLENEDALPRAFVPSVVHVGSVAPLMEMSLAEDLRNHAWIEANVPPYVNSNGPGDVRITRRKLGFKINANMKHAGWVIVSESAWPGWRAYVDGQRVQHRFADVTLIGIYVPDGKHTVRLVYWPDSFVIGRAISAATLAGIAIYAVIARRRRAIRDTARESRPS